ncbi:MAG: trypsin-like peptidase domain-containing protein [Candidatus Vogelbacteria bacterium]|nr:trypsin-like peptidase domain-containing protein [Candidatus Vogelbacteria bacterium]
MEELNKNQIIMLALLVSFITSIATGIVTVSLMDQSPQGVTQTINQVIERTVEKVVQAPAAVGTVKEVPLIVTGEDLLIKAINQASGGVVHIEAKSTYSRDENKQGTGFLFLNKNNLVITTNLVVPNRGFHYEVSSSLGSSTSATLVNVDTKTGLVVLRLDKPITVKGDISTWPTVSGADTTIGQMVVALGAAATDPIVAIGNITGVTSGVASTSLTSLLTTAATTQTIGGPLLNLKGEIVGMVSGTGTAIPGKYLNILIDSVK